MSLTLGGAVDGTYASFGLRPFEKISPTPIPIPFGTYTGGDMGSSRYQTQKMEAEVYVPLSFATIFKTEVYAKLPICEKVEIVKDSVLTIHSNFDVQHHTECLVAQSLGISHNNIISYLSECTVISESDLSVEVYTDTTYSVDGLIVYGQAYGS